MTEVQLTLAQQLAGRISLARAAWEMNAIAEEAARADLPDDVREHLQVQFARRCRQLWPGVAR